MSKIYFDSNGKILRIIKNKADEKRSINVPEGTVNIIRLDEYTNSSLLNDMVYFNSLYSLSSGVLQKNGSPITITPSGQVSVDRTRIRRIKQKIDSDQALSSAEMATVLRIIIHELKLDE